MPRHRFDSGLKNYRQLELKERLDDMLDLACLAQKQMIEKMGQEKFYESTKGIPITKFLATYNIKHGVGDYASKRYFRNFRDAEIFIQQYQFFKVAEESYKQWLKENEEESSEG